MKRWGLYFAWFSAAIMLVIAVALPPERVVRIVLPAKGAAYIDNLLAGMWCLKVALAVNGLLLLVFRPLRRWLWDVPANVAGSVRPFWNRADPGPICGSERWIFAGIVLLGLALRLVGTRQSLFGDEIAVQQMFISRGLPVIFTYFPYTPQHVGYSVLAWFFEKLPVAIELSYRLPAILFGTGAVALTYLIARQIFSRPVAMITGGLSAVAFFGIAYSHVAKGYSATHCLTLIAWLAIIAIVKDWRAAKGWLWFGIALGALGYIHLYNAFLCMSLTVVATLLMGVPAWKRLGFVLGLVGAILFLLYALQLPQIREQMARAASQPEEHLSLRFLRAWLMQLTFWGTAWPVALGCLGLAGIGVVSLGRREPRLTLLLLGTPAILLLVVALKDSWVLPRYLVFTLPVLLILCVEAARVIGKVAGVIVFAAIFLWPTMPVLARYYQVGHQNIRGAAQAAPATATVVSYGLARDLFPFYNRRIQPLKTFEELQALKGDVYLVYGWRKAWRGRADEYEYIDKRFDVVRRFEGMTMDLDEPDGDVVLLRTKQ